jgi:tetratricopeptide (TPR) repeat protein
VKTSFLSLSSIITFFCFNLGSQLTFARLTDNQVSYSVLATQIQITVKNGFHLNAEAPATASFDNQKMLVKPKTKTEKLFVFETPEKTKKAKLSFYVCDDKKTACEQHQKDLDLVTSAANAMKEVAFAKNNGKTNSKASAKESKKLNLVNAGEKPTLLIFSAPWCPACIRMQTEVYPQKSVQAELSKVNVTKLNIDLPENSELADKFHVQAIPTLVLVNSNGQEITRWLDFQSANTFAKQLESNTKNSVSIADIEKKADLGDPTSISAMGMNAFNSVNCEEAIKWLSQSKKIVDLNFKLASEVTCAEEKDQDVAKNKSDYKETLQKALTMTMSQLDQYRWTVDWIEKAKEEGPLSDEIKNKAKITLENFSQLLKSEKNLDEAFSESTYGDVGPFQREEIYYLKAKLYAALGLEPERKEILKNMVTLVNKKKLTVQRPGEVLLAIAYLREADEKAKAIEWYQKLIAVNPDTYVYHEKYARYLLKEKNAQTALTEVDTALKFAEGNQPQLYLLKARILKEMNDTKTAISVLDKAKTLENIQHQKYKKTVAQIDKLKKEWNTEIK